VEFLERTHCVVALIYMALLGTFCGRIYLTAWLTMWHSQHAGDNGALLSELRLLAFVVTALPDINRLLCPQNPMIFYGGTGSRCDRSVMVCIQTTEVPKLGISWKPSSTWNFMNMWEYLHAARLCATCELMKVLIRRVTLDIGPRDLPKDLR